VFNNVVIYCIDQSIELQQQLISCQLPYTKCSILLSVGRTPSVLFNVLNVVCARLKCGGQSRLLGKKYKLI
jgi:hypothetical protein